MTPALQTSVEAMQRPSGPSCNNGKLVVVGLPGWRTSAAILNAQLELSGLTKLLKDRIEFVCVDPPHLAEGPPDPLIEKLNVPGPYYQWTLKPPSDHNEDNPHPGFMESCRYFAKKLQEIKEAKGRVDGFLGFSQGGCMACLFQLCHQTGVSRLPFLPRFMILVSAVVPEAVMDSKWMKNTERIVTPSLHIAGELDSYYPNNLKLAKCAFEDPTFVSHKQGHLIPRLSKEEKSVTDCILQFFDSVWESASVVASEGNDQVELPSQDPLATASAAEEVIPARA